MSANEVTTYTFPPAPPVVNRPAPYAPGNAAIEERSGAGYSSNVLSVSGLLSPSPLLSVSGGTSVPPETGLSSEHATTEAERMKHSKPK